MSVIGYKYHAAIYCPDCGAGLPDVDPEGNDKHAIHDWEADSVDSPVSCDSCRAIIGGFSLTEEGAHYVLEAAVLDAERVVRGERPNDGWFYDVLREYGDSLRSLLRGHQLGIIESVAQYDRAVTAGALGVWRLGEDNGGELPALTDMGGYPMYYLDTEGGTLCADCADSVHNVIVSGADVHYEGAPITCDDCGESVESAYGDPMGDNL